MGYLGQQDFRVALISHRTTRLLAISLETLCPEDLALTLGTGHSVFVYPGEAEYKLVS